ncbi:hypothetical protein SAMN05216553_12631 [Lentzea fradiae]|uniref:Uncharacterized protein n=1 Tax=Lentzea fradiae TaxID=200378 RepID=A0A1G8D577_9PSEU|nr:hypothetical protein [Lentzea fradiae]SDH52896.1 hypothetical protein SAMN05216553_12631 [Lentzea fradiae]
MINLFNKIRQARSARSKKRAEADLRNLDGDLGLLMPPPYDMSDEELERGRQEVDDLMSRLQPGGLDAGSREVLFNLINDWLDVAVARLDGERDERQAVAEILIGLARTEVARIKPLYDSKLTRCLHTREALDAAFRDLTGKETKQLEDSAPIRFDQRKVGSTLGQVENEDFGPVPGWATSSIVEGDDPGAPRGGKRIESDPTAARDGAPQDRTVVGDGDAATVRRMFPLAGENTTTSPATNHNHGNR